MYAFEYQRAKSVADAAAALSKSGGKALAGGQSLVGAMKLRLANPGTVVDLSGIGELKGIKKEGDAIVIGAMTTHAEVASSSAVKQAIPALAALAEGIGDRQVRNRGTLGGSLANNDPAADYPAAVLALNATVLTNKRKIAADDFFKGMYETALGADERGPRCSGFCGRQIHGHAGDAASSLGCNAGREAIARALESGRTDMNRRGH